MTLSREERLTGVLEAHASCRLDGLPMSATAIRDGGTSLRAGEPLTKSSKMRSADTRGQNPERA